MLPLVVAEVPWARVRVTGSLPAPLDRFEGMTCMRRASCRFGGLLPPLRVAIAPLRFGAGVKLKTVEALQYGVPVVATTVGAEGLEDLQGEVIVVHDAPVAFAAAVVARLRDVDIWRAHRAAIDRAMADVPTSTDWAAWLVDTTMEGANVRHPV